MSYKALLFDLDDTILDFAASEDRALEVLYQEFFKDTCPLAQYKKAYSTINRSLWSEVEKGLLSPEYVKNERFNQLMKELNVSKDVNALSLFYQNALGDEIRFFPDTEKSLEQLKEHFLIGVVTNGLTLVQEKKFHLCDMTKWCTSFLISEKIGIAKPDKKIFALALKELGALPNETLMIGDSLASDYVGALNSELDFCWINPLGSALPSHLPFPKFILKSVALLPHLLLPHLTHS